MFFKKRKMATDNKEDRELVEYNSKSIDVLRVLSENDASITNELKKIQEEIKFLIPSHEAVVFDFDKKIKAQIEDIKILFTKNADGKMDEKIKDATRDLKILIAERNSHR